MKSTTRVTATRTASLTIFEPREGERGYGYQWWIPWRPNCESMALGAFGQMIWLDTKRGVSIAQLRAQGGDDSTAAPEATEDTHAAMRAIVDAVTE